MDGVQQSCASGNLDLWDDKDKITKVKQQYDKIKVRTREDKNDTDLWDIITLDVNNEEIIIVTDKLNNCVKSFYTVTGQWCHSILPLDNFPHGLSKLKENQVVITVPWSKQIITVKVNPDLMLLSTMETRKRYYGIAVLNPQSLAAACIKYYCVDILDMSGQVIRTVSKHNQIGLFELPSFLCVNNKGNILVSDGGKKTVTCLTPDGDVVWQYAPTGDRQLQFPGGVTTDSEGNVLLADRYANKVNQLTETGEFVREVVTVISGISQPRGLTCHKPGRVLVCENTSVREFSLTEDNISYQGSFVMK